MGAAGGGSAAGLDVDEVFSTFLHTGTGSSQTITNGIDLSGEGGLVWLKIRNDDGSNNILYDTVRPLISGNISRLISNSTAAVNEGSNEVNSFNSNGFALGGSGNTNGSSLDYVSWTWRKAPKFFDVVKYVGNGSTQTISHNLGSVPGMMIVKCLDNGGNWRVFHTSVGNTKGGYLAENLEFDDDVYWNDTTPSSTVFTVGNKNDTNGNNLNYIAYLFAHNNNDGEFGPDSDQDIIKCGSYTGNGSASGPVVNLGFEPQFLMIKSSSAGGSDNDWYVVDTMRRFEALPQHDAGSQFLKWNTNDDEPSSGQAQRVAVNSTGFSPIGNSTGWNSNSQNYIYMAIRRGPLAAPDDADKVFAIGERGQNSPPPAYQAGFTVDMFTNRSDVTASTQWYTFDRLRGKKETLFLDASTDEQAYGGNAYAFDQMQGIGSSTNSDVNNYSWMWKRAPSYFDVVAWTGNDTAGRTVAHNLGVVPEMIWVKNRSAAVEWVVYHKDVSRGFLKLNTTDEKTGGYAFGADSSNDAQSATNIILSSGNAVNELNKNYIGYLFATAAGVSKVGSITATGSTINVDCGFSNGAKFILMKRTDSTTAGWLVWDSVRGIVSGNDPYLLINATSAEVTDTDYVDPLSSGFTLSDDFYSAGTWIFYAIAA